MADHLDDFALLDLWRRQTQTPVAEDYAALRRAALGPALVKLSELSGVVLDRRIARAYDDAAAARELGELVDIDAAEINPEIAEAAGTPPARLIPATQRVHAALPAIATKRIVAAQMSQFLGFDCFSIAQRAAAGRLITDQQFAKASPRVMSYLEQLGFTERIDRVGCAPAYTEAGIIAQTIAGLRDGSLVSRGRRGDLAGEWVDIPATGYAGDWFRNPREDWVRFGREPSERFYDVRVMRAADARDTADQVEQERRPAPRGHVERVALTILEERREALVPRGLPAASTAIAGLMEPAPKPDTVRRGIGRRFRELEAATTRIG